MKVYLLLSSLLLTLVLRGQYYYTSQDFVGNQGSHGSSLRFNTLGDSQVVAAFQNFFRFHGVSVEKLVIFNRQTGSISNSYDPRLNAPQFMPQVTDVKLFNRIGYLVYYDTTGAHSSWYGSILRHHKFLAYGSNTTLWEGTGSLLALPEGFNVDPVCEPNGESWFLNPISEELLKINLYNGDTLLIKSFGDLKSQWGFDTTYHIGGINLVNTPNNRRDTLVVGVTSWKVDSFGNVLDSRHYTFLARFPTLDRISDTTTVLSLPIAGNYTLRSQSDSVDYDFQNNVLDKTVYEYNRISEKWVPILKVDTLSFDADTARFSPNHRIYRLLQNETFKAYVEVYKKPIPGFPSSDMTSLKIRLYKHDSIVFQRVLDLLSFPGFASLTITHYRLLEDGSILLSGVNGVGFSGGNVMFLMKVSSTGQTSLSFVDSDPMPRDELQVFPTLVEDFLTIRSETEIEEVMALSLDGKQLLPVKRIGEDRVDLSACASGWYLVLIKTEGQQRIFKVFKK